MGQTTPGSGSVARPPSVLLVDDEDVIREAMRELFQEEGFVVVGECANGADAVRVAAESRPEVVLMDLRMPVLDGIEATARITELLPDTQVIVLTAYDDPALERDAIRAGAYRFVPKGISVPLLLQVVQSAVSRARERTG